MALGAFALRMDKYTPTHYLAAMRAQDAIQTRFAIEYQGTYHGRGISGFPIWISAITCPGMTGNCWSHIPRPSQMPFQGVCMLQCIHGKEGSDVGRLRQLSVHFWVNRKPEFDGGERHGRTHTWE